MDRFIPNRSAMDLDYFHSVMTQRPKPSSPQNPRQNPTNPFYQALLSAALGKSHSSRILAFGNRNNARNRLSLPEIPYRRFKFPPKPELVLDAPGLVCYDSLNALDWGANDVVAVALSESLYGFNFNSKDNFEIASYEESVVVTGVNWNPDGRRIAVGLSSGEVEVWDVSVERRIGSYSAGRGRGHVGAMGWNGFENLTIANGDGRIVDWDLGCNEIVASYRGHKGEVLGLKWSLATACSRWLATSGKDMDVNVWDRRKPSSQFCKFAEHLSLARGIDWSPVRSDLLVTGGLDCLIKFWSISSGKCLKSVNTGSEVLGLLWNHSQCELISSHGSPGNHFSLWRYPSMEITGKSEDFPSRLMYMAGSPDGVKVASALEASAPEAEDEKVMVWNFHNRPKLQKNVVGNGG